MASTAYNPAANGLAEAFNKKIIKLLKKYQASKTRMRSSVNVSLGLSNYGSNPDRQYPFFSGIQVRSSHTARNPDAITTDRLSNQDD